MTPAGASPAPRASLAAAIACAGVVIVALVQACSSDPAKGYSFNSSFNSEIKTVHVSIFQNPTYYHGLETDLADAVIKQIQSQTPWRVAGPSDAQTAITGTITDVQLRRLSTAGASGLVQELDYQITVEFAWKDNRTGKVLASRKNFTASDVFTPSLPINERIEAGEHGAAQKLARDLVAELRSTW